MESEIEPTPGEISVAIKAVDDAGQGWPGTDGLQRDGMGVAMPAVARVDDDRQAQVERKIELGVEVFTLARQRGEIVVAFDADLAQGEETASTQETCQSGEFARETIAGGMGAERIEPDAGVDEAGMLAGQGERGGTIVQAGADGHEPREAGGAGARDDLAAIGGEALVGQMAVAVEAGRCRFRRADRQDGGSHARIVVRQSPTPARLSRPPSSHHRAAMAARRNPLLLTIAIVGLLLGLWFGIQLLSRWRQGAIDRQGLRPDLSIVAAMPAELARHGFKLSGKEPASWRDISVRQKEDRTRALLALRCTIAPDDAARLIAFPPAAVRPADDQPPQHWPRGAANDPWRLPDWWQPTGNQCLRWELADGDGAAGLFASYDPATHVLHFWRWHEAGRTLPPPAATLAFDLLATALEQAARGSGIAPTPAQDPNAVWLIAAGLTRERLGAVGKHLPAGITSVALAAHPRAGRHRYLIALTGLDEAAALALLHDRPMRPRPDDEPPPESWSFAFPPGGLPVWAKPGPGPRRAYARLRLGTGAVETGRWAAYDRTARVLLVWDWSEETPMPGADLTPLPVRN